MPRRFRLLWSVCIGHLTNDIFASMTPVLLTFLAAGIMPMSNIQIGLTVGIAQLLNALPQPFFGLRADRSGGRRLGSLGLAAPRWLVHACCGVGRDHTPILADVLPASHRSLLAAPPCTRSARCMPPKSVPRRSAFHMAIFFLMGQTGLALGPAIAGILLDQANPNLIGRMGALIGSTQFGLQSNLTPIILLSLISIPGTLYSCGRVFPNTTSITLPRTSGSPSRRMARNSTSRCWHLSSWGLLWFCAAWVNRGSVAFVPLLFEQKGWSPAAYGTITSSYWIASGISGLIFGRLADRFDRRKVMMWSMILSAPAFFLLPAHEGAFAFFLAMAAGGLSGGAHSLIVVMAQDLIPLRKGFASGAILGFIFGTGAIGSLAIGAISDQIGLSTTFEIVALIIAVAGLLSLLLPRQSSE